ncbi:MAG: ABC transporter ATP-binding protein, partial [Armatimonadota bacterium]
KLFENRTSFVVAHRLSTILEADKILVIESGKITESGTHNELLALNKHYAKLYNAQYAQKIK